MSLIKEIKEGKTLYTQDFWIAGILHPDQTLFGDNIATLTWGEDIGKKIKCPVVAIQGDYDLRQASVVEDQLSGKIGTSNKYCWKSAVIIPGWNNTPVIISSRY